MEFDKKESLSYLDGVPMRIGAKFCPPRNVSLPLAFTPCFPLDLLEEEYDFSLERQVLETASKAKTCEEESAAKAREEKVSSDIENFAQGSSLKSSQEDQPAELNSSAKSTTLPASNWQSSSILQPQLQYKTKENGPLQSKDNSKCINLSDFENDTSSPFDYMELQTINDFEELSTVFQGLNENNFVASTSKLPNKDSKNANIYSSVNCSVPSSSINSETKEQTFGNFSKSSSFSLPENSSFENSDKTHFSSENIYCDLYNKRLPASSFDMNGGNQLSYSYPGVTKPIDYASTEEGEIQEPTVKYGGSGGNCSVSYRAASTAAALSHEHSSINQHIFAENKGYGVLRSSKSVSDLYSPPVVKNVSSSSLGRSHTPPPTMMVSMQAYENSHAKQTFAKEIFNENQDNGSYIGLLDPYDELQSSEKLFVDSITDMGFLRGQVARTVKHLGVDDKKVVEHLCQIQMLEESGYDSLEAEAALHLHDYNRDEAKKYLDLLNQIQGLGFEKTAIKKALVQNKNDMDKAINALLL